MVLLISVKVGKYTKMVSGNLMENSGLVISYPSALINTTNNNAITS